MKKNFDGKKTAKLGTEKNPGVVNVQTKERVKELESVFEENGWEYTIELEPDKPEDISALETLYISNRFLQILILILSLFLLFVHLQHRDSFQCPI